MKNKEWEKIDKIKLAERLINMLDSMIIKKESHTARSREMMSNALKGLNQLSEDKNEVVINRWISINVRKPQPQELVYVVCKNKKNKYQTMARYIPYMSIKEEDHMNEEYWGEGDYNESEDEYYTPEGFYEDQTVPEMNWKLSDEVTHWMPLFKLPKI